jgi:predicted ferric reductase
MNENKESVTWPELAMYVVGGISGAALGILAGLWMQQAVAAQSPFFWFVTRASAIVAYLLLWLSTAWGVTISSKGIGGRVSGVLAYAMHNVTSWLALSFSLVHALTLLGDASVPFTMPGIFVPFLADYKTLLTGLGTLSLYLGAAVTGAFYLKKRLGLRAWRTIHGLSYLMFATVTVHSILLGTDTSTVVMKAIYLVAGVSVTLLTAFRVLTVKSGKGRTPRERAPRARTTEQEPAA